MRRGILGGRCPAALDGDHAPAPLDRCREGLVEGVPSPTAKFGVGIGDAPDAARSPLVDYRGMPAAELVTTHGELLLEEDGVRGVSQENVDVVRRAFDAIGRRDIDALLTLYDARIEFLPLTGTRVESGGYAGHAGVRDYFEETAEVWEEMRPYAEALRSVGEHVVVIGSCAVRGRGSGAECDDPMAWVITVRRGKIIRHRGYPTGEEALDAVGLRE